MSSKGIIIQVSRDDRGGYVVTDARLRRHEVSDPSLLPRLLDRLLADPEMPTVDAQPVSDDVAIGARLARAVAKRARPDAVALIDTAEPLAHQAVDFFSKVRKVFAPTPQVKPRRPRRRLASLKEGGG